MKSIHQSKRDTLLRKHQNGQRLKAFLLIIIVLLDYAQSCYEACVDAHNAINDKPLKFFLDKGRLSKFIQEIASELESQIKQKRLSSEYQIRVDCFNHISQKILEPKVVQNSLF